MIYLIEDDNNIRELVVYTLTQLGLNTLGFDRPSLFWEAMEDSVPELILLDIMLPEQNGMEILKSIRSSRLTSTLPVIMLTAKSDEYDKVQGLENGADDYITKPFGMMELTARVKALLRRSKINNEDTSYTIGNLFVSTSGHEVKVDGNNVLLTLKEYDLLCLLLSNRGKVLTRDNILINVWGYEFDGENRTVDVHIRTLRQKLGSAGAYIKTVRGVGYKIDINNSIVGDQK